MRAYELYENDLDSLGIYDPSQDSLSQRHLTDTRRGRLTLGHLNRLNRIRKARAAEKEKKRSLVVRMYGDSTVQAQRQALEAERALVQQERKQAKRDLKRGKQAIQKQIGKAELDNEQREHIRAMAMKAIKSGKT